MPKIRSITRSRSTTAPERRMRRHWIATVLVSGSLALAVCSGVLAQVSIDDLRIRAEAGDKTAIRELAEAYYLGSSVGQDFTQAAQWYEKLAKQGDARAQTSLGLMYARGYGVEKNLETARKWWSFAAAQNDPGAQYNLGIVYAGGQGVPRDDAQAAQWFREAATRGHVQAQHNLGLMYFEGRGVGRDLGRAYYWFAVAALQGDPDSRAAKEKVGAFMTDAQIREAEARARDWMKQAKKAWQQVPR